MKKYFVILCLAMSLNGLMGVNTSKSIFFADSYMLRAQGVEANYWNPAKLKEMKYVDLWFPGVNTGVFVGNNALDLDFYNYVMSRDVLTEEDKDELLSRFDRNLTIQATGNMSLFGFTTGNLALSSTANFYSKASVSKKYLRLMLNGNTDDEYNFTLANNNISSLSYADVTLGMGDLKMPFLPESFPEIKMGFSAGLLIGLYSLDTKDYHGYFGQNIDDGASLSQDITLRTGIGGYGFKGMLGMYSEITPNLEAGITLDNVASSLNWSLIKKDLNYKFEAQNVYVSNISEDFFTQSHEETDGEAFATELPPELRVALLYKLKFLSVSADYVQGFKDSVVTNKSGRLAMGLKLVPMKWLPITFGVSLPQGTNKLKTSYGIGLADKFVELGLAVQTYDSFLPGYSSKGLSFATNLRVWF